mmetsp:Transcript_93354/g.237617  ORF Transcript_93354/g.237617 Transcript_93354/m.237617 type:complete len:223 (+) Transcript_93354:149-817(+)
MVPRSAQLGCRARVLPVFGWQLCPYDLLVEAHPGVLLPPRRDEHVRARACALRPGGQIRHVHIQLDRKVARDQVGHFECSTDLGIREGPLGQGAREEFAQSPVWYARCVHAEDGQPERAPGGSQQALRCPRRQDEGHLDGTAPFWREGHRAHLPSAEAEGWWLWHRHSGCRSGHRRRRTVQGRLGTRGEEAEVECRFLGQCASSRLAQTVSRCRLLRDHELV